MPTHVLYTGPIGGSIPIDHPDHPSGYVDVTPGILYFEHDDDTQPPDSLLAVAKAIEEADQRLRGTSTEGGS